MGEEERRASLSGEGRRDWGGLDDAGAQAAQTV